MYAPVYHKHRLRNVREVRKQGLCSRYDSAGVYAPVYHEHRLRNVREVREQGLCSGSDSAGVYEMPRRYRLFGRRVLLCRWDM